MKPEWLSDEKLGSLSDSERVLTIGLILMSDDYGRGKANPALVRSTIWPYRDPPESLQRITERLQKLSVIGFIRLYEVDGQHYYEISNWSKHQKISHPGRYMEPCPPEDSGESLEDSGESPKNYRPDLNHNHNLNQESTRARDTDITKTEPLRCAALDDPEPSTYEHQEYVWQSVIADWVAISGMPHDAQSNRSAAEAILRLATAVDSKSPKDSVRKALKAWVSDEWVRSHRPSITNLVKFFDRYVSDAPPLPEEKTEPSRRAVYERDTKSFDDRQRETNKRLEAESEEDNAAARESALEIVKNLAVKKSLDNELSENQKAEDYQRKREELRKSKA